jgi:hypothetical protein
MVFALNKYQEQCACRCLAYVDAGHKQRVACVVKSLHMLLPRHRRQSCASLCRTLHYYSELGHNITERHGTERCTYCAYVGVSKQRERRLYIHNPCKCILPLRHGNMGMTYRTPKQAVAHRLSYCSRSSTATVRLHVHGRVQHDCSIYTPG